MKTFKKFLHCLLAGRTALHLAAYPGNLPCLALLLGMEGVLVGPDFPRIHIFGDHSFLSKDAFCCEDVAQV